MSTDWKLKVITFLHDPFDKPLTLFDTVSGGHEFRAVEFLKLLGVEGKQPKEVKDADWIASASNRIWLVKPDGKEPRINFKKVPALRHPLSGASYNLTRHGGPLEKFKFDEPGVNQFTEKAKATVVKQLTELKNRFADDFRKIFLSLWRNIPEVLSKECVQDYSLGELWRFLPADSRLPDHSIWDHLSTASAIVNTFPNPALFIFTIGPVQSFIETARKTRDLWTSSYLLSYLTWQAIKKVASQLGPDSILFPYLWGQPLADHWFLEEGIIDKSFFNRSLLHMPTLPNRFLAMIPKDKAKEIGQYCQEAVMKSWKTIGTSVREKAEEKTTCLKDDEVWNELWNRQIENAFETFWASLPWPENIEHGLNQYAEWIDIAENGKELSFHVIQDLKDFYNKINKNTNNGILYSINYDFLERGLGARKATRIFSQVTEQGFKCSLCGIREALHTKDKESYHDLRNFWIELAKSWKIDFLQEGREKLCAVCFTKRLASKSYFKEEIKLFDDISFPSTSTISAANFVFDILEKIQEGIPEFEVTMNNFVISLEEYFNKVGIESQTFTCHKVWELACKIGENAKKFAKFDGDWFFEETYEKEYQEQELGETLTSEEDLLLKCAAASFKKLIKTAKNEKYKVSKPAKYFALLYMDGDDMGKWLSGEKAPVFFKTLHEDLENEIRNHLQNDKVEREEKALFQHLEKKRLLAPSLHTAISRSLADFSLYVTREIVESRYKGKIVYAGGDDLLALVTLEDLLDVLYELRLAFSGESFQSSNNGTKKFRSGGGFVQIGDKLCMMMGETATASIGVAIAHHTHPLSHILQEARLAEKTAKKDIGRNAFVIHLLKRSGSALRIGMPWTTVQAPTENGEKLWTIPLLKQLLQCFKDDELSPKVGYQIVEEEIVGMLEDKAQEVELKRILARHLSIKNKEDKEKKLEALSHAVYPLLELQKEIIKNAQSKKDVDAYFAESNGFKRLGETFQFLSFLVRGDLK